MSSAVTLDSHSLSELPDVLIHCLSGECINNSDAIQIPVVVPTPYLQYIFRQSVQVVPKHFELRVCDIEICQIVIF